MAISLNSSEHTITIEYCPACGWLFRASWYAQELLNTFASFSVSVSLQGSEPGVFRVWYDHLLLWDRKKEARFPESKEIKQIIRDYLAPEMPLGHTDSDQ
jgi:selenoprotein W-related protein